MGKGKAIIAWTLIVVEWTLTTREDIVDYYMIEF